MCSVATRSDQKVLRTPAMSEDDTRWFTERGFAVVQTLLLLERTCRNETVRFAHINQLTWRRLKSRRNAELGASMLRLDAEAFPPPWSFSRDALASACLATDEHVVLISGELDSSMNGFAIVGRSARNAYLQRIAVRCDEQRRGVGTALVRHALAWANHRGAQTMLVNTEPSNVGALALYRRLHFATLPQSLYVLERPVH
jgi:ribosomal protein S18 acetylase RimI-like enzyme